MYLFGCPTDRRRNQLLHAPFPRNALPSDAACASSSTNIILLLQVPYNVCVLLCLQQCWFWRFWLLMVYREPRGSSKTVAMKLRPNSNIGYDFLGPNSIMAPQLDHLRNGTATTDHPSRVCGFNLEDNAVPK